ncbi:hypothetical protein WJX74_009951 [Apatococcus lobatus]|uniref:Uncharacterized protein n=2 Tax=Apatococcus TaxID=904362 RepID=A0AAW1TBN3_9CHLO
MTTDGKSLGIAVGIDAFVGFLALLFFELLRNSKFGNHFYEPKIFTAGGGLKRPPALPKGIFRWTIPTLSASRQTISNVAGADGAMYIMLLRFGIELFAVLSVATLIIILPTNIKGNAIARGLAASAGSTTFTDLDTVTMTNVARRSNLLWIHALVTWAATLWIFWMVWRYTKQALNLRMDYFMRTKKGAETHSVLVRDVPGQGGMFAMGGGGGENEPDRGSQKGDSGVASAVRGVLSRGFRHADQDAGSGNMSGSIELTRAENGASGDGDVVEEIHPMHNTSKLDPLVKEYKKLQQNLEDLVDDIKFRKLHGKPIKPKQVRVIGLRYGSWGLQKYGKKPVKVDALEFWPARLEHLQHEIKAEQPHAEDATLSNAFVTFKYRKEQVQAIQHPTRGCKIKAAPAPSDIVWQNIKLSGKQRKVRFMVIWVLFALLALFYMIPVGAIQAILEVQRLQNITPFKQLVNISFTRSLIESILPVIVLKLFLALLPKILAFMNTKQGISSRSGNDFGVVKKYFIFQVITVFFASFIGGSFFTQLKQWVKDPGSAVTIIGSAAPKTSIFFLTFIVLQALLASPIQFLRLFALLIYWLLTVMAGTERAKRRVWSQQSLLYGPYVPDHTIIILLGIVFCCVNPLLCVAACVYFCIVWLLEKYNMLYVWQETYQAGGKLWLSIIPQVLSGVFIFHIMMLGLLGIKESYSSIIVAPLPIIDLVFWLFCKRHFSRPMQMLSLDGAAQLDQKDEAHQEQPRPQRSGDLEAQQGPQPPDSAEQSYIDPSLMFDEQRHTQMLKELGDIKEVLQGSKILRSEVGEPEVNPQVRADDPWGHVYDGPGQTAGRDGSSQEHQFGRS